MMKTLGKPSSSHGVTVPKAPPLDLSTVQPPFEPSPPSYIPHENRDNRIFGLRPAPVFYPTVEEFADPLLYIEKIRSKAEDSGICKIVPPAGWKPDFALDTQTFWFTTRIQKLNSMEGGSRSILNYLDQLQKFHHQQGNPFTRIPMLDKKPIDLHKLKKEVAQRGGVDVKFSTCSVKSTYTKWVQPYEDFMAANSHGEGTPKKQTQDDRTQKGSLTPMASTPEVKIKTETPELGSQSAQSEGGRRSRRAKKKAEESISTQASPSPEPATPTPNVQGKENRSRGKGKDKDKNSVLPDNYIPLTGEELCEICGGGENDEQMLLCDGCNRGYHLYCLNPPMASIPTTDWFCMKCLKVSGNDYGFEDGEVRSLYHFQIVANAFKEKYFANKPGAKLNENGKPIVTEDECEREFWRLIESPYDDVEVEYGADLHSSQHGSGFPVVEKQPTNPYSLCGWNLNNIPVLPASLFCNIRNDISGMMIPWLYVGMCFSTFCWHTEDHYTYSINYHHWGETKTWYGIPASNADKFEDAMRIAVPELFEGNPDLLFHLTTLINPQTLVTHDVDVCALDQRPGEFVITFPRAYHAGFNHGFNFAEAVNFALPNWLPHGLNCAERYHEFHKQPVFSHDELVISTCKKEGNIRSALWLKRELDALRERESTARQLIRDTYPNIQEIVDDSEIAKEEEDQCLVCHQYCYASSMVCGECSPGKVSCLSLDHVRELCKCPASRSLRLRMRFTEKALDEVALRVSQVANKPTDWKEKHDKLMLEHRRPPLKELQRLLSQSEKIPYVIEEAVALRTFIDRALEWVEQANKILHKRKRSTAHRKSLPDFVETLPREVAEPVSQRGGPRRGNVNVNVATTERTLSNIENLLKEAKALPFDCPEIKLLQSLADSVQEFCSKAREVLNDPNLTLQALKDTQEWGVSLDVGELPEMVRIEARISEMAWGSRADELIDLIEAKVPVYLENVNAMIDEGRGYGIRADHPIMAGLKKHWLDGERWKIDATGLLKHRVINMKELEDVLGRAAGIPVVPDLLKKLEGIKASVADWKAKAAPVLRDIQDRIGAGSLEAQGLGAPRPVAEIKALVEELDALPVRLDEAGPLREQYKRVTDWMNKGKKVFFKQGSAKSFGNVLEEALANVRNCTTPGHQSDDGLWCLCRTRDEEGTMIECESCGVWYHGLCVRLSSKEMRGINHYICPVCDLTSEVMRGRRPVLFQVRQLITEAQTLPFAVPEMAVLNEITTLLDGWHQTVDRLLQDKDVHTEVVRDFLRCAEGLIVGMDDCDTLREALEARKVAKTSTPVAAERSVDAGASSSSSPPEGAKEVFCICRKGDSIGRPMICCDDCDEWFHFDCVGITVEDAIRDKDYHCPMCLKKKEDREGMTAPGRDQSRGTGSFLFAPVVPADGGKTVVPKIIPVVESVPSGSGAGAAPVTTVKLKIPIVKPVVGDDVGGSGSGKKKTSKTEKHRAEQGDGGSGGASRKRKESADGGSEREKPKRRKSVQHSTGEKHGEKRKLEHQDDRYRHDSTAKKFRPIATHAQQTGPATSVPASLGFENVQLPSLLSQFPLDLPSRPQPPSDTFPTSSRPQQLPMMLPPLSTLASNPLPPPPPPTQPPHFFAPPRQGGFLSAPFLPMQQPGTWQRPASHGDHSSNHSQGTSAGYNGYVATPYGLARQ
ncbi:hypothetical protein HDV00_006248 [Rhizophlyctis rosea]|nr:hypothetical protein HDV00_006248 [Rhizophlyctis rosea]